MSAQPTPGAPTITRINDVPGIDSFNCLLTGPPGSGVPLELDSSITDRLIVLGYTSEKVDGALDADAVRSGQYTIRALALVAGAPTVSPGLRVLTNVYTRLEDIPGVVLHQTTVTASASVIAQLYSRFLQAARDAAETAKVDNSITSDDLKEQARLKQQFDTLVNSALDEGASDIHITVHGDEATIAFRIHTILHPMATLTAKEAKALQRAAYNTMADEKSRGDPSNVEAQYQDASIERALADGSSVRIRYASTPLDDGWKVVLRLLTIGKRDEVDLSFEDLGYAPDHARMLREIFARPTGLLIVAGVTGSGKSTTLKHGLRRIIVARPGDAVYTVEEPVEYRIKGAEQIPVKRRKARKEGDAPKIDPFAEALRALLRLDPNVIMVGEMRDAITAALAADAGLTGHKVLTTLHASSGLEVAPRLAGDGLRVSPDLLGAPNFINGILYQALVPTLCPHCRVPVDLNAWRRSTDRDLRELAERLAGAEQFTGGRLYHSSGKNCGTPNCRGGTNGVTVAAEVIVPDAPMRAAFRAADYGRAEELWRAQRQLDKPDDFHGRSAMEHALRKMLDGLVSPVHVEAAFGFIPTDMLAEYVRHYHPAPQLTAEAGP